MTLFLGERIPAGIPVAGRQRYAGSTAVRMSSSVVRSLRNLLHRRSVTTRVFPVSRKNIHEQFPLQLCLSPLSLRQSWKSFFIREHDAVQSSSALHHVSGLSFDPFSSLIRMGGMGITETQRIKDSSQSVVGGGSLGILPPVSVRFRTKTHFLCP